MGMIKDLLGERFGEWTVIDYVGINNYGRPVWLCQCNCGTWRELTHNTLIMGRSTSCGCERKIAKLNDYILTDDVCKCILPNGNEVLFDREDYPKIAQHRWSTNGTYIYTIIDGHNMMMHRLIMDCPDDMVVDHINRKPWDNRKCNLRICTPLQNAWNTIHPRFTEGFRGVTKLRGNNWRVEIRVNSERIIIGTYSTFEEAVEARLKAEQFYFGEYAPKEYDD